MTITVRVINSFPFPLLKITGNIRNYITTNTLLYESLLNFNITSGNRGWVVRTDTEIIIEGFPRSANTFAVYAFAFAQMRKIRIAHHIHVPAQIIKGVKLGIPTLVLIRNPLDTLLSHLVRNPYLSPPISIRSYIHFYKTIIPYKRWFVLGEFTEVTTNFTNIIKKINKKFSTNFKLFDYNEEKTNKIFSLIDIANRKYNQGLINTVARPLKQKNALKEKFRLMFQAPENKTLLNKAISIYESLIGK